MENIQYLLSDDTPFAFRPPHPLFKVEAGLSPYAGCRWGCAYCPHSTSGRMGVHTNFLHLLKEKLNREKRLFHFGLGTACEPYCEEEEKFKLTRHTIELIMERCRPLQIFTKSPRIMRDIPILKEYSAQGMLAVSVSLFTADERLSRLFEPGAPPPGERFELIRELRRNGIVAGAVLAPILPYVSDAREQMGEVVRKVKKCGGEYLLPLALTLPSPTVRRRMKDILVWKFPKIEHRIEMLYGSDGLSSLTYARRIHDALKTLSDAYGLPLRLPVATAGDGKEGIRYRLPQ